MNKPRTATHLRRRGLTLKVIGQHMHLTRERVRQLLIEHQQHVRRCELMYLGQLDRINDVPNLSTRAKHVLRRMGITRMNQVTSIDLGLVEYQPNCGIHTVAEITTLYERMVHDGP